MYSLFISHAWKYNAEYHTIIEWLDGSGLFYRNYSVPNHDPLDAGNTAKLKAALTEQMRHANCVIIIAGMYAAHSGWIDYEINEAVRMGKTIIGIEPWGQERVPSKIVQNANKMVGWNKASLISAIKTYC